MPPFDENQLVNAMMPPSPAQADAQRQQAVAAIMPDDAGFEQLDVLPFMVNQATGQTRWGTPPWLDALVRGFTAPRDIAQGRRTDIEQAAMETAAAFGGGARSASIFGPDDLGAWFGIMAGPRARTASMLGLNEAKKAPETAYKNTGWFKDLDGKWKHEISDQAAKLIGDLDPQADMYDLEKVLAKIDFTPDPALGGQFKVKKLSQVLAHDDFFAAYPKMREMDVKIIPSDAPGSFAAEYDPAINRITLRETIDPAEMRRTLLHEIQHAVQEYEGFARGGDPSMFRGIDTTYEMDRLARLENRKKLIEALDKKGLSVGDVQIWFKDPKYGHSVGRNYSGKREAPVVLEEGALGLPDEVMENQPIVPVGTFHDTEEVDRAITSIRTMLEGDRMAKYRNLHGEVESRTVEQRADMTPEQRAAESPMETGLSLGPAERRIFRFGADWTDPI